MAEGMRMNKLRVFLYMSVLPDTTGEIQRKKKGKWIHRVLSHAGCLREQSYLTSHGGSYCLVVF